MSGLKKERLTEIVNGFDNEDIKIILSMISEDMLWDELRGRSDNKSGIINDISSRLMINLEV